MGTAPRRGSSSRPDTGTISALAPKITLRCSLQQQLCEATFFNRLDTQYNKYLRGCGGKEHFQRFLGFVEPWPIFQSEMHEMNFYLRRNIVSYVDWRMKQHPKPKKRYLARRQLIQSIIRCQ